MSTHLVHHSSVGRECRGLTEGIPQHSQAVGQSGHLPGASWRGEPLFSAHLRWQNAVPCSYRTEVFVSLLAARRGLGSCSHPHASSCATLPTFKPADESDPSDPLRFPVSLTPLPPLARESSLKGLLRFRRARPGTQDSVPICGQLCHVAHRHHGRDLSHIHSSGELGGASLGSHLEIFLPLRYHLPWEV